MTEDDVSCDDLIAVRETLINLIVKDFTEEERLFLISFKEGSPNWDLLGLDYNISELPAIQWKLANIAKIGSEKHLEALKILRNKLELI